MGWPGKGQDLLVLPMMWDTSDRVRGHPVPVPALGTHRPVGWRKHQDTAQAQGSKPATLLSWGEMSLPPDPRWAPSGPERKLEKDFICQLPSSIPGGFASLGTAGPCDAPQASGGQVCTCPSAVSTTWPSCPPASEERNTPLSLQKAQARSVFPFHNENTIMFSALNNIWAEAAGSPSSDIPLPHAASHSGSTKRTTSS